MNNTARVLAVLLTALPFAAVAQTRPAAPYPAKPIRMIVGFAPGGGSDIFGRIIAQHMVDAMGQPVVVENRPGGAQNVAAELVARAPADGYTLLLSSATLGTNISTYRKINYDPMRDFAPAALFATSPNLLVVHPSFPAGNVKEFLAAMRRHPAQITYSSSGSGTTQHLTGELLAMLTGAKLIHVPYKGSGPSMTALASGEVAFSFTSLPSAQPLLAAKRIRALGITSEKRSPLLPQLGTLIEAGLAGFINHAWYGVLTPAGAPPEVITTLNTVIVRIAQREDFRSRLAQLGADPVAEPPQFFADFLKNEIARWARVVRESKIAQE